MSHSLLRAALILGKLALVLFWLAFLVFIFGLHPY